MNLFRKTGLVGDEGESRPIPHYPGDYAHVGWCKVCQQYKQDRWGGETFPEWQKRIERESVIDPEDPGVEGWPPVEVPSWDVYAPVL